MRTRHGHCRCSRVHLCRTNCGVYVEGKPSHRKLAVAVAVACPIIDAVGIERHSTCLMHGVETMTYTPSNGSRVTTAGGGIVREVWHGHPYGRRQYHVPILVDQAAELGVVKRVVERLAHNVGGICGWPKHKGGKRVQPKTRRTPRIYRGVPRQMKTGWRNSIIKKTQRERLFSVLSCMPSIVAL